MANLKKSNNSINKENLEDTEAFIKLATGDANALFMVNDVGDESKSVKIKMPAPFTGLSKDQLLIYATDPQWVMIRRVVLGLFWVLWLAMLVAAILLIVLTPKCPYKPKMEWHQKGVIYQINSEKFIDSNGDGIGDING